MNFKFVIKVIITILIFLIISNFYCVNAVDSDQTKTPDNFNFSQFESESSAGSNIENKVNSVAGQIVGILRIVSVTIALVILLVIAMRYMLSAPGDRADIKKYSVNYVIAAVILFGATGIISILVKLAEVLK